MIYADFNATTPLSPAATTAMKRAIDRWGNPSSAHEIGRHAKELLEQAREAVSQQIGVGPEELVFTSGGSEANSMVLLGSWLGCETPPFRLLTSEVEHSSVRDAADYLKERGANMQFVRLLPTGSIDLDYFEEQLEKFKPHLVSLMTANNETGILFPVRQIWKLCSKCGIVFHTDAVQAFGKVHRSEWNVADFISVSAHKIFGPKGVGALAVRRSQKLASTRFGGSQEKKRRSGTENMLGIAGFAGACSELDGEDNWQRIRCLRDCFEKKLSTQLDGIFFQGAHAARIPNTTNVGFQGIAAEILLTALDLDGVCVSAGSACFSGSSKPSHVLLALGLPPERAKECLRISWGRTTTDEEMDHAADRLISHVNRIRNRRSG
ncbi:MAG: cysteine desulfurase [Deltaproteobacteria bacterium]|nr:cysteine desulfurase [Deltaproteobacteria bacterium]